MFSILFLVLGSIQAQKLFQLNALNPSFILYGSEFSQGEMAIISADISFQIQVNALFLNFDTTKFHFFGNDNKTYTQIDVQNGGSKGIRVNGEIQFFMDQGNNDFYVSFSICPTANRTATLGYDNYTLHLFDGLSNSSSYTVSAGPDAYRMITIINKQYSAASCYNFDMKNIQFFNTDSSCSMRIYQSGPTGLTVGSPALLYTLSAGNAGTFIPPTLGAAYYTFLVNANCSVSFDLGKHVEGTIQIDDGSYSRGFVVSCDFPGTNFSRKESVKGFQKSFHATGRSTFPISIDVQGAPGSGGYLGVEIWEQNKLVAGSNFTVEQAMNVNGTAHDIRLNWLPGETGRTGFLATFKYQGPTTEYFVVDKNPLIFDSTFSNIIEKVIEANGSYIQVNIQPMTSPLPDIYFNDNSTSISIHDLAKAPTSFKDFVHVSYSSKTSDFLAAFTSYASESERDQLGLTDYTLISVGNSGTTPIQFGSQNRGKPRAITFFHRYSMEMALGNVQLANGCEANLYVHGIPSTEMKGKMLLYKFNSDNAAQFIRSDVVASAATLIVKENCDFSADVKAVNNDLSAASFEFGANGFVMSSEFPGNYDNRLSTFSSIPIFQIFYKDTYLDPEAKFSVNVVGADPGEDGNCSIIITNSEKIKKKFETVYHTLNITSPVQNQLFQANGYSLQVYWSPTITKNGFLMTYTMEKSSFSASIFFTFIFAMKFLLH